MLDRPPMLVMTELTAETAVHCCMFATFTSGSDMLVW